MDGTSLLTKRPHRYNPAQCAPVVKRARTFTVDDMHRMLCDMNVRLTHAEQTNNLLAAKVMHLEAIVDGRHRPPSYIS